MRLSKDKGVGRRTTKQFLSKPGQNSQGTLMSRRQLEVNIVMEDTE